MAIQKCPYCKAIIDEGAEYCTNCGTKLLFPEDEFIEEEIPGERIADEDIDEESLPKKEEAPPRVKKKEIPVASQEEEISEEIIEEEMIDPDEGAVEMGERVEASGEYEDKIDIDEGINKDNQTQRTEDFLDEVVEKIRTKEEVFEAAKEEPDSVGEKEEQEVNQKDVEVSEKNLPSEREHASELESILEDQKETQETHKPDVPGDSETKQKEEIDKFLESLRKDREGKEDDILEQEDELPPWAAEIKERAAQEISEEATPVKMEQIPQEDDTIPDTESALPEALDQPILPFSEEYEEVVKGEKVEPSRKRASPKILTWFKARVFDILLITSLWFITLWIASQVVEVSVFKLIAASVSAVLIFFGILLVLYFFFFFFFLKETLGDFLFSQD